MPPSDLFRVPCPTCGSQMRFSAEKQQLRCDHCGNTQAIPFTKTKLEERPLNGYQVENQLLPNAPTEEKLVFDCPNCGARTTANADVPTITCAFCGTKNVNPEAHKTRLIEPAGVLPFRLSREQAIERFKTWVGDDWLAPSDLKAGAMPDNFRGIYIPFWTFDAQAYSNWQGEAGFYYYVTVRVPDGKGGTMNQQEQRVRWEPRSGSHSAFYDDILIMASKQLANQEESVAEASSYNMADVLDYDPRFLLGWDAEVYSIDLPDSARRAEADIHNREEGACSSEMGGNVQRNLHVSTQLTNQTFKHILLPLWICAYVYNGKAYRFLVNGQTGRIAGERPKSAIKITLLVIGFLLLVLLFYMLGKK
jgi:ribosomal protein S27E